MPKKVTIDQWKKKSANKHNNFYDYSLVEFSRVHDVVTIICPIHGEFTQKAYSHNQGKGCPRCANNKQSKKKTKTRAQFIHQANVIHSDKYDYSKVEYVHKDKKVIVICHDHGEWLVTPGNHINCRSGCPQCYHKQTSDRQKGIRRPGIGGVSPKKKEEFVAQAITIHGDIYDYTDTNYINSRNKIKIKCQKHGEFEQLPSAHLQGQGCAKCAFTNNRSRGEIEIAELIQSWGITIETNNRDLIDSELDIVAPEHNIAIEYCGLYWHSEKAKSKDRKYHVSKCDLAEKHNYQLITIFEDEWLNKKEIVTRRLRYAFNKGDRGAGARTLSVKEIRWSDAKEFLNTYHIQGSGQSGYKRYGAYHNDNLVGVMTFCKPRIAMGRNTGHPELLRFSTDGKNYPGLASKLFMRFVRDENPEGVISYADRRWSTGGLYRSLGFVQTGISTPSYWYTKDYRSRAHRYAFRKQKVVEMGGDINLSEWQNMQNMGYDRIWDCGNLKFVWTRS